MKKGETSPPNNWEYPCLIMVINGKQSRIMDESWL
jgi:hypothetical protein